MLAGYYQHLIELNGLADWVDYHMISVFIFAIFYTYIWKTLGNNQKFDGADKLVGRLFLAIIGFPASILLPWLLPFIMVIGLAVITYAGLELLLGKYQITKKE